MSANDREFIKNLLLVDDPGTSPVSWTNFLKPSRAWAQQGNQPAAPHPAVGPGPNRDAAVQDSQANKPKPSPLATPKEVKEAQEFRQQQQKTQQQQKRYYQQNTW